MSTPLKPFQSFKEFYPFYISQHMNPICRVLHVIGTSGLFALIALAAVTGEGFYLYFLPVMGYGFAWIGHFVFEHNRPATFKHPLWSLMGDFVMYFEVITMKRPIRESAQIV